MNYAASVSDFFKTPKWGMSLLLGIVAVFIPIVGYMLLMGWVITGFWSRREQNFEHFPPFDFTRFEKYFTRGVWPVAVSFAPALVVMLLSFALMLPVMFVTAAAANEESPGWIVGGSFLLLMSVFALLFCAMFVLMVPLTLRAGMMQEFVAAFEVKFLKRYFALVWKETLLTALFLMATSMLLQFIGLLVFCVGAYAMPVIIVFATMHLDKQLYALYLARGGEPIPLNPALLDEPPALPGNPGAAPTVD